MDRENQEKKAILVASHQGHFFPWLGYLDKMARSELFLINDVCQLELKSPMMRNKVLDINGDWHYFKLSIVKEHYKSLENRYIKLRSWDEDRQKIEGLLRMCYGSSEYWSEIWEGLEEILSDKFEYLIDAQMASICYLKECFGIHTKIIRHSTLDYREVESTSGKIVEKLKSVGAGTYLSGNGAKKYLEADVFENSGIKLLFQNFSHPLYPQLFSGEFVSNMSAIDLLFNCGIDKSREIFWNNIKNENKSVVQEFE